MTELKNKKNKKSWLMKFTERYKKQYGQDPSNQEIMVAIEMRFRRLSMKRELYTIEQAACLMNQSRNTFSDEYIKTGRIIMKLRGTSLLVPDSELKRVISEMPNRVHKNSLRRVQ